MLLGRIGNALFAGNSLTAPDIARMGQWAENVYFGKPCGLMDQLASSTGGLVFMDFRDPAAPLVRRLDAALPGYVLCVVDSGADHAGLTEAYAAIPRELGAVCRLFGAEVLRQVEEMRRLEDRVLPQDIDYLSIHGLRMEARQKLQDIRPRNLGQASRVSGVSPADVAVLMIYLKQAENATHREEERRT